MSSDGDCFGGLRPVSFYLGKSAKRTSLISQNRAIALFP